VPLPFELANVTGDYFQPRIGTTIWVDSVPERVALKLVNVRFAPAGPAYIRPGFILILASRPDILLVEATYRFLLGDDAVDLHMAPLPGAIHPEHGRLYQIIIH